jgi:Rps23 Pro-64 3,4-dihydroxylase Tpa1-like proline 4-hydroxylase
MDLQLNNMLDVDALARDYAVRRRLQINSFLMPYSAGRIYRCLAEETPWGLVYNQYTGKDKVLELNHEEVSKLNPEQMKQIYRDVYARAKDTYQFIYYYYPILTSYLSGKNREFFLHRVLEFINTEPMLDFMRRLTGIPELIKADAQATLYKGNTFLSLHHDKVNPEDKRRCAYVMNFTKDWQPNWGGYLQFFDKKGNVEAAFMPTYNGLNVFTVPQDHSVGFVPAFCGGSRFSITGWFTD